MDENYEAHVLIMCGCHNEMMVWPEMEGMKEGKITFERFELKNFIMGFGS